MSVLHAHQPARRLWWAGLLVAGFLVASSLAAHAEAAFGACRSDPLVTFPNGITVDLHATIGANLSDVRHVSYVLHGSQQDSAAPSSVVYPDGTGPISDVSYVADAQPHQYYAIVTVTTGGSSVPVTAYLDWTAGGKHNTGTAQVAGLSEQPLQTPALRIVCANMC